MKRTYAVLTSNLIFTLILSMLFGCGSRNSDLQAPPEVYSSKPFESPEGKPFADPKVNILFVVDNSQSMDRYQKKLAKNVKLFAQGFFKNSRIDYRIGVVPVYDSKYLNDTTVYSSGVRKMNALGELVPLKGLSPEDKGSPLFITRDTINPELVLESTVAIGTQWGPEAEESFSPVLAVMNPEINAQKNGGFYESDAYLTVIFLTDADDVTPTSNGGILSGSEFYQILKTLKGDDESKILIAAAVPNIGNNSDECKKDGGGPIQSIPQLLRASKAIVADLCSEDFGTKLTSFGRLLAQRVSTTRIALGFKPDINSVEVYYGPRGSLDGSQERVKVQRGPGGYLFDTKTNEVTISEDFDLPRIENGTIFVKAKPANLANSDNGRLTEE